MNLKTLISNDLVGRFKILHSVYSSLNHRACYMPISIESRQLNE